jgi:hypothetical protein
MRKMGGKRGGKLGKTKKGTYKKRINRKRANRRRTNRKQTGGTIIDNIDFSKYPATGKNLEEAQMDVAFTKHKQITIYAAEIKYPNVTGWHVHTDEDDLKKINRQFSEIFNTYDSTNSLTEGHIWTKEGKFLGNRLIVEPYYDNESEDNSNIVALNFYHTDKYGRKTFIRNVTDDQGKTTYKTYPLKPDTILEFYHVKPGENRLTLTQIKITYKRPPRPTSV